MANENKVYFGTKNSMRWVKPPAVNTPLSSAGWSSVGNDLNGGGYVKLSDASSKEYRFEWGASPAQEVYDILDYRSGAYGSGLIYYNDPFAMRYNILCEAISYPAILAQTGRFSGATTVSTVASTTLGMPQQVVNSAVAQTSRSQYIPIPPGYKLCLAYTSSVANSMTVNGANATYTAPAATALVWNTYTAAGAEILWKTTATANILYGAIAILIPTKETPPTGTKWRLGKGHSGLRFSGEPQVTGISAVIGGSYGLVNASASFKETGLWE